KILFLSLSFLFFIGLNAQKIEKKWQLSTSKNDFLELKEGTYQLKLSSDSLFQKGDYLIQDKYLFLFENGSDSPTKRFLIETQTDSTLTIKKGEKAYSFFASNKVKNLANAEELKPSEGLSGISI